jgi:hypothetical protein
MERNRKGKDTMANTSKRKPTAKRRTAKKSDSPARARPTPTDEEIRRRAYELFEQRGGAHGYEHEDWVRAERELRGEE